MLLLCRVKVSVTAPTHRQRVSCLRLQGLLSLSLSLSGIRLKTRNINSDVAGRLFRNFQATFLTRSALVVCELGSAAAASHRGRVSDGAQRLAVSTCVQQQQQQQPAPTLMLTVRTSTVRVRDLGLGTRFSPKRDEVGAYLPSAPSPHPTPYPPFDSWEMSPPVLSFRCVVSHDTGG